MSAAAGGELVAVVVLYRVRAEESAAFCGLREALAGEAAGRVELMVCDNTPTVQAAPAGFRGVYWRDPTNPGLARCYNRALGRARETGAAWLMLLDHDTAVTEEYLAEVLRLVREMDGRPEVVALVPKLVDSEGGVLSPHRPPTLRHFRGDAAPTGLVEGAICAFNSGAVLRVSALRAMGGFDEEFWLDFLDHVTLRGLERRGGRVFVMRARLGHAMSLSSRTEAGFSVARHRNSVDAERRYYAKYGSERERWLLRARLVKHAVGAAVKHGDFERARYMLGAAMGFAPVAPRAALPPEGAGAEGGRAADDAGKGAAR